MKIDEPCCERCYWVEVYTVIMGIAIALDLILVGTGYTSISMTTWIATQLHPTLIAAGILATIYICYLIRYSWRAVMFNGLMGGHLFIHW